ncbi:MAG: pyruvate kinase [Planctomycetaceae bacterium]|nr:pyruvate kinase [Planctomycetaceae bacterium]
MTGDPGPRIPRTKIVATVGPACESADGLRAIVEAGADVLRLNLSHGTLDAHRSTLSLIRELEARLDRPIAVMADLPGPKIRLAGAVTDELATGSEVTLGGPAAAVDDSKLRLAIDADGVLESITVGDRVLLDDGNIRLRSLAVEGAGVDLVVRCSVRSGGPLRPRMGVNLPDSDPDLPAVTPRDLELAQAMASDGVDYVAVSFVRDGGDLRRLRTTLDAEGTRPGLVAKIERPAAVHDIEDVIAASDAVLVARGDLGVEMDIAKVPVVQKRIVASAVAAGLPVIVATQMLQSMIDSPTPTRAEATDAANAVLDGTDALMLSGETAIGRHPTAAIEMLGRIAVATEDWSDESGRSAVTGMSHADPADPWMPAIAAGARRIAREIRARAVLAWSHDEHTASLLSRERFQVPILVFTSEIRLARRMRLLRGVRPVVVEPVSGRGEFLRVAVAEAVARNVAGVGDACVFVHGSGRDSDRPTDAIGVLRVGDEGGPDT